MAIETLRKTLPRWVAWKESAVDLFAGSAYPLPSGTPKFLGYLIQRFNIRQGRAARPYRDNIQEIKDRISDGFIEDLSKAGMTLSEADYGSIKKDQYCLGEIPDFQGLLPKSHSVGVPVFEIRDDEMRETGPILDGLVEKRNMFGQQFADISTKLINLIDHA
jgi:hypothetical protein